MKNNIVCLLLLVLLSAGCKKQAEEHIPADPLDFKATVAIGNNVLLSWAAPAGQDIKEYSLSFLPDGVPRNISRDSTSVLVTNLKKGETYSFSLKVRDAAGNLSSGATLQVTAILKDTTNVPVTDSGRAVFTGDLILSSQAEVDHFNKAYSRIDGTLTISGADIRSLLPLASIDTVKALEIYSNDTLTSLAGLNKLKSINGTLYIRENKKLLSLKELGNLETVEKDLVILGNKQLADLDGLLKLRTVNGSLYIGVEGWKTPAKARGNQSLANYCGLKLLLTGNGLKGGFFIEHNLSNPDRNSILSNCP